MRKSSPGWAWVLQHSKQIQNASSYFARSRGFDVDDFHQELAIRLARRACDFDPAKGAPSTWIGHQARAVASTFNYNRNKTSAEAPPDAGLHVADVGAQNQIENNCAVQMVKRNVTENDFSILLARAFSLTDEECKRTLGMSRWGMARKAKHISQRLT